MGTNSVSDVVVIFTIYITTLTLSISTIDSTEDNQLGWIPMTSLSSSSTCEGSIAECQSDNEFQMDSEINRRILAATKYITPAAVKQDIVPCTIPGAPYSNCKHGAEANPYTGGCSPINKCRGHY
ncbi:Rapid ALkalinization Factor [Macleaya cordata]|uniref:Rapid ALkalinization Factor n=1 Tax=Macleaya cordata TaxID=56857 RepID=A0A200QWQ2_MACCD|nr:Rapid ALkalinization Factor [Macleaya cordata]